MTVTAAPASSERSGARANETGANPGAGPQEIPKSELGANRSAAQPPRPRSTAIDAAQASGRGNPTRKRDAASGTSRAAWRSRRAPTRCSLSA